ncbi:MAG: DUF6788 family protein [Gemmataceae bacterium]
MAERHGTVGRICETGLGTERRNGTVDGDFANGGARQPGGVSWKRLRAKRCFALQGLPVQTKSAKTLPKMLPGAVCWQWIRCGRTGCRCAKGKLHGPYAYRFYRQGNRLRKEYVRKANVKQVVEACEARRAFHRQLKASLQEWRDLLAQIREAESP